MNRNQIVLVLLSFCLLLLSCKNKTIHQPEENKNYDYPVVVIPDTISVNVMDEVALYDMTEEFMNSFLAKAGNYAGHKVTAETTLPEEWGVRCVERLPEGRELWLLQSKSREWIYLAVTSGYGTQRILDLMPVALDLTNQSEDVLESEKWSTIRQSDGSFLVSKEYKWTRSLSNATKQAYKADPEKFHKNSLFIDNYHINDAGRFEYVEQVDTVPEYNAVVFFYNRVSKPEMWDDNVSRLQAFCEENNIFYEEVYSNFDQVNIRNFTMAPILTVDINPLIHNMEAGMVMMKKEAGPKSVSFGGFDYMQMEVKRYFKVNSPNPAAL